MLREHQVRHLLVTAESTLGVRLEKLRKHLASRDPRPYIWELLVIDALLSAGATLRYETNSGSGLTPDLFVSVNSTALWIEVANVRDRFAADEAKTWAILRRLAREEQQRGIPRGAIEWRTDGVQTAAGYRKRLPSEHELPRFFRMPELVAFFEKIRNAPGQHASCDLLSSGYTISFTYTPRAGSGPFGRSGGGVLSDVPTTVEEHSVYRVVRQKARRYSRLKDESPFVVCIGSEDSKPASTWQSVNAVSLDRAVASAFEGFEVLSAVVVVSVESNNSVRNYGRVARARMFVNRRASAPLPTDAIEFLERLDFNGIEYGGAWNEWDGRNSIAKRRRALGGDLRVGGAVKGGFMVELPAEVALRMLAGVMTPEEFLEEYRLADLSASGSPNPFRRAWETGRELVGVTFTPGDPRRRDGARLRFDFGPPQEMLLQVRRQADLNSDGRSEYLGAGDETE